MSPNSSLFVAASTSRRDARHRVARNEHGVWTRHPRAANLAPMRPFTSLVVFALILVLLRRVTGIPISIVGSLALTIVVNVIMARLTSHKD